MLLALEAMGSLSFAEILTIVVVILIVFGPKRLPELARKAGELLAKVRQATSALSKQLETELGDTMEPIRGLKGEYDGVKQDLSDVVTAIGGSAASPEPGSQGDEADPEGTPDEEADGEGEEPSAGEVA